jgi:hypothetical protein
MAIPPSSTHYQIIYNLRQLLNDPSRQLREERRYTLQERYVSEQDGRWGTEVFDHYVEGDGA